MLMIHPNIRVNSRGDVTGALLVRDGDVVALGDDARRLAGADDVVVRPDCACLMPALIEAHAHPWGIGQRAGVCELGGCGSAAEALGRLAAHGVGASGWVLGSGWDDNLWGGEALGIAGLDALFGEAPVFLLRVDHHAALVNTAALRAAGITAGWEPARGGRAAVDGAGRLTGLLVDGAMEPVQALIPEPTLEDDRRLFERSAAMYRGLGVCAAHNALVSVAQQRMIAAMAAEGPLPLRIYSMIDGMDAGLGELLEAGPVVDPMLSGAAVKFFADGAMGSRGALLWEPYPDGSSGLEVVGADALMARVPGLMEAGWQVCVHAIGDRAASHVLDAFGAASQAARRRVRPRLEHCQMMRHEDIARMGALGVVASVQPIHMFSDTPWAPALVGEARVGRLFAYRRMWEAGCVIAGGSDYPIDDPSPWRGIAAAVGRVNRAGEVFEAGQALPREVALGAYLEGAAWAGHMEGRLGRLERGFLAELIGVELDPWTCEVEALGSQRVCCSLRSQSWGS
jgi:predicted amidohydrolase YtcJ